jgi:hypothetical protein
MTYASGGNGTILHLASGDVPRRSRRQGRHIPYKGVGPMLTDLIGGQVDFATAALPSVQQHLKSGALKAIGMATRSACRRRPTSPPSSNRACRATWSRPGSPSSGPRACRRPTCSACMRRWSRPLPTPR